MDASLSLGRFCFLGTLLPYYQRKQESVNISTNLEQIKELVQQIDTDLYLSILELCLESKEIPRKDEVWFTYVVYITNTTKEPSDKQKLRTAFSKLARTSEDLFLFAKLSKDLSTLQSRKGFPKPVIKTIKYWYAEQSVEQICEMITVNRGNYGISHKELVKTCHISLNKLKKNDIAPLLNFKVNSESNQVSDPVKKVYDIWSIKKSGDPKLIVDAIQEGKLKFGQIPFYILKRVDFWEILLPTLPCHLLLKSLHFLIKMKLLKVFVIYRAFMSALENLFDEDRPHPIFFLIELNKQMKVARYSEKIKRSYYAKKIEKLNIEVKPNTIINKKLENIMEISFDGLSPIGKSMFITINLQANYKKKPVFKQEEVSCMDAAVTLAFSYYKTEGESAVYTYSPDKFKLEPIPWVEDCTFRKAKEICNTLIKQKNEQLPYLCLIEALKKPEIYDLFLIIVPSAARRNRGFTNAEIVSHLEIYRKQKNPNARVVIVNLRRYKPALIHKPSEDNGILEICSFDENTPKLIKAFALNQFS